MRDVLFCKRVDVACDVLRLATRQRYVHSGVRIKHRERQQFRTEGELPGDCFKRRRIGDFSALAGSNEVAGHASHLRKTFAIVGISGDRQRGPAHRSKGQAEVDPAQAIVLS